MNSNQTFNVVVIAQSGRLQYEAALFAASFRHFNPDFPGRLLIAEPQPGGAWPKDPRINDPEIRQLLQRLNAEILPFTAKHFGQTYPYSSLIHISLCRRTNLSSSCC